MRSFSSGTLGFLITLVTLNLSITSLVLVSSAESEDTAKELVSIGESGPEATKFKVWTNKEEGEAFHPGDRVIVFLSSERQAYVTILAVSSEGGVTVVLPNKLMPDNLIQAGKLYALFGDDAPVRINIAERPNKGELVLYLSSAPLPLDPSQIPKGNAWLTVATSAQKEIETLKEKLRTLSREDGFNRATLILPSETSENLEIKLTEVPQRGVRKALPGAIESSVPEPVTGTAGLKPLRKGKTKE